MYSAESIVYCVLQNHKIMLNTLPALWQVKYITHLNIYIYFFFEGKFLPIKYVVHSAIT